LDVFLKDFSRKSFQPKAALLTKARGEPSKNPVDDLAQVDFEFGGHDECAAVWTRSIRQ